MKRVLLVTPFFPPQHAAASLRTASFARVWAELGADVTVLTTKKRRDQQGMPAKVPGVQVQEIAFQVKGFIERARADHKREQAGEPKIGSTKEGRAAKVKRWTGAYSAARMPDVTDAWVRPAVAWAKLHGPWDIVVSSIGPYTAHLVALKLKQAGVAARWVGDYRDLWTGNHIYHGLFPFTLKEKYLERRCLAAMDHVTAVSAPLAKWLQRRTKVTVDIIPNGFDPETERSVQSLPESEPAFRLVYTGSIHRRGQSPEPLLQALKILDMGRDKSSLPIRLVVAGSSQPLWSARANKLGILHMIEGRGLLAQEDSLSLQASADALIVLDWDHVDAGVLTTKLCEYLPCDAPVLAIGARQGSGECVVEQVLQATGRGLHLGGDAKHISEVIEKMVDDPSALGLVKNNAEIAVYQRPGLATKMWKIMTADQSN